MSQTHLTSGNPLIGACTVPGDRSISHRAVIFGALADGQSQVRGFFDGGDCRATDADYALARWLVHYHPAIDMRSRVLQQRHPHRMVL